MKNIKSIIITLTITLLLVSLLPTTTAEATTINQPTQQATLECCKIAYNRLLDFNIDYLTDVLNPLEEANYNVYDSYASDLESYGMKFSDVSSILMNSRYAEGCLWYNCR
jgi:hypothetical protein